MGRPIGSKKPEAEISRITYWRLKRRITQRDLCTASGIPWRTYRRLEAGEIDNPSIRHLTNLALALGVKLDRLLEPEWTEWTVFHGGSAKPPRAATLFGSADLKQEERGEDFASKRPPKPKPVKKAPIVPTQRSPRHVVIEEARQAALARREEALRALEQRRSK